MRRENARKKVAKVDSRFFPFRDRSMRVGGKCMSGLPSEIYQVNSILDRYIVIHDAIFKFSLRKAIPIPGVFKPIDYWQHLRVLDALVSELQEIVESTTNITTVPNVFQQYIGALQGTMQFLRDMCRRLYEKSHGDLRSYTQGQYKSDVTKYEMLVKNYRELGTKLNEVIRK
jgi:hypothetical protein